MRWLILPDVHDEIRRVNQIIEREPHDHLLLMGDFFDDFRTGVTDAADTARQVKRWLNAPNITCLLATMICPTGGVVRIGGSSALVTTKPSGSPFTAP